MSKEIYDKKCRDLAANPKRWLITGAAGFIGSNLTAKLLALGQEVVGLDNFVTGKRENLRDIGLEVGPEALRRFEFIEGDIRSQETCQRACQKIDYVLHQAALGSVPRSIQNPLATHASNVDGFVNMLVAARDAKIRRFVYASSSSVYGDHPDLPKIEKNIGNQLSPYAVTKRVNELYAPVFASHYGLSSVGLRYFNVFGSRQDPDGPYAAVIPKWIGAILQREVIVVNGDGQTSRDFCHIDNAVQANILAALVPDDKISPIYNVAVGEQTSLNQILEIIQNIVLRLRPDLPKPAVQYREFRAGDVRHSLADIALARNELGYSPELRVTDGLEKLVTQLVKAQ